MAMIEAALSLNASGVALDDRRGVAPLAAPSAENVARFDAAMGDAEGWLDGAVPGGPFGAGTEPGLPGGPAGRNLTDMGDRVMNKLDVISDGYMALKTNMGGTPGGGTPPIVEVLRMQATLVEATVNIELVSRVITRSTQNIDQLTRIQ